MAGNKYTKAAGSKTAAASIALNCSFQRSLYKKIHSMAESLSMTDQDIIRIGTALFIRRNMTPDEIRTASKSI